MYTGIAVALAWPQTYCKQTSAWYDGLLRLLGINKDYYYRAGHAAVILVDKLTAKPYYYDFGRYHAPYGFGRARSGYTDHDLRISTLVKFCSQNNWVENIGELLDELQLNRSCHGDGKLYASQFQINFAAARAEAMSFQNRVFVPYGPFILGGSNCSRFVYSVLMAGKPALFRRFLLSFLIPLTPTPLSNVRAGTRKVIVQRFALSGKVIEKIPRPNFREWATDLNWIKTTKPEVVRHPNVPEGAQWLSGEGYGSWHYIEGSSSKIILYRYSPYGDIESKSEFSLNGLKVDFSLPYKITYPTNSSVVTIVQNGFTFELIGGS